MQKFNRRHTFALRKLHVGVASIVLASGSFLLVQHDGHAAENSPVSQETPTAVLPKPELKDSATDQTEALDPAFSQVERQGEEETEALDLAFSQVERRGEEETEALDLAFSRVERQEEEETEALDLSFSRVERQEDGETEALDPSFSRVERQEEKETKALDPAFSQVERQEDGETEALDPAFSQVERQGEEETEALDPAFSRVERQGDGETEGLDPSFSRVERQEEEETEQSQVLPAPQVQPPKAKAFVSNEGKSKKEANHLKVVESQPTATTPPAPVSSLEKQVNALTQAQYKNRYPVIFVHGFGGFVGDNAPAGTQYWGGNKYKMIDELRQAGYNVFEASVSAFGSNWDRAVELYHFIKGGVTDYGQAHAEKYGHERFGKYYEGIFPDWKPGQKVHLVGHSMGGQTIRMLEALLRKGDPEEIAYQQAHGGTMSALFQGQQDQMIASITTLATPHNGTVASDDLGNTDVIKRLLYEYSLFEGRTGSKIDYGLKQWGLAQRPGETYAAYAKRASQSPLFTSKDTALYDLTREGAQQLNARADLNPDIYYKTFTGSATHTTVFGTEIADPYMNILHVLTGDFIGMTEDVAWRKNDGLVSVISAQRPENQSYINVGFDDAPQKGVWQVTPTLEGWDHTDFTGQDTLDWHRSGDELQRFYHHLLEELVSEEV